MCLQISMSESNVLSIDLVGNCWSYVKNSNKWNSITQILQRDEQVSTTENQNRDQNYLCTNEVCCSDTIHLSVTHNGIHSFKHTVILCFCI